MLLAEPVQGPASTAVQQQRGTCPPCTVTHFGGLPPIGFCCLLYTRAWTVSMTLHRGCTISMIVHIAAALCCMHHAVHTHTQLFCVLLPCGGLCVCGVCLCICVCVLQCAAAGIVIHNTASEFWCCTSTQVPCFHMYHPHMLAHTVSASIWGASLMQHCSQFLYGGTAIRLKAAVVGATGTCAACVLSCAVATFKVVTLSTPCQV